MLDCRIIVFLSISALFSITGEVIAAEKKPNIVYILADDLGWKDVGFHGGLAKTPNLDKLAMKGARLEKFYTLPYSTPTRSAFLTGRYPMRFGLQLMSILPWNSYGIPKSERLLSEALNTVGYHTAAFGEWRLGHAKRELRPTQRGFDQFYGSLNKGRSHYKNPTIENQDWWTDEEQTKVRGYDTELIAGKVKNFILEKSDQTPFFMYIAFPAPASPFEAPKKYLNLYKNIESNDLRTYYAMISALDQAIGEIVETLNTQGLLKNTLIIFHSDNGGAVRNKYKTGDGDVPVTVADNGPFFNGKGSLYEGGIRVSALAYWENIIKPQMTTEPIHITDMYPTLAKLAGVSLDPSEQVKPLDGVDVWPTIMKGDPTPRKEILINADEFRGGLIIGNWKLIVYATLPGRMELFNIQDDPTEENNRSNTEPVILKKLLKRFNDYAWEMAPSQYLKDLAAPHDSYAPIFWRNNPTRP